LQNYIPLYDKLFSLNETNYNAINLNNKWHLTNLLQKESNNHNHKYKAKLRHYKLNKVKEKLIFIKLAPLLDPFKYLVGKYVINDDLFNLPSKDTTQVVDKINCPNNAAYVDGFFAYLNSCLLTEYNFSHGLDFFGSFLGINANFKLNVCDDLEYLHNSDFFKKNENVLYTIDDYKHLFNDDKKRKPINIQNSFKSMISCESINDLEFDNLFKETNVTTTSTNVDELEDLSEIEEIDLKIENCMSLKSNSTCSSRTSHTSLESESILSEESSTFSESHSSILTSDEDDEIFVTINKFPVQLIALECCENTLDNLILNEELSDEEWKSALMQIIMILITFQKAFSFTHNDLHTNNVMYISTEKKYLYYCYNKILYKVPTFGRLFKIIDFGRAIYKCKGNLFCSDSFKTGEDAATQYNTDPYLNNNKPRLDPNFSFDLCRLACSIFDYIVDDLDEIKNLDDCSPIKKLIVEWCLDDNGLNLLYKTNGVDRYPDFKLYKMIARHVHNHTPQAQLNREMFKQYTFVNKELPKDLINIDNIPSFIN
jgi:hypothetical protein